MYKYLLLMLALVVAEISTAEVRSLPYPTVNYHTFSQEVSKSPKVSKLTKELKQAAKEFKEELNAKKVDIILLNSGDTCLLAYNKNGEMALCDSRKKILGAPFSSPWSSSLNIIKVKGNDKLYFLEGMTTIGTAEPEKINFINTTDGRNITSGFNRLHAFEIDGSVYLHAYADKYKFYHIFSVYPFKELPYQCSTSPYHYVTASDDSLASDKVKDFTITLPTIPHGPYFSSQGSRLYLDGTKDVDPNNSNHNFSLDNSGYYVTTYDPYDLSVSATTGIVDGKDKTGTTVSIKPTKSDSYMDLCLYGPDGGELLRGCQSVSFSEPDQMIYYTRHDKDRRLLMGAMSMSDTSLYLPPRFAHVQRAINAEGNGVWLVSPKAFAPLEIYDPDKDYTPVYRNKIEENYNNRCYFDVVNHVEFTKDPLSYEDLLLGLSAYTIYISDMMPDVERIVAKYRTGIEPEGMDNAKSMNRMSIGILTNSYPFLKLDDFCQEIVQKAPQKDKELANKVAAEAKNINQRADKLVNEDLMNARRDYNELIAQRRIDKAKAEALAAQRAQEAAIREAQLREERQQAFALAFLNGLSNIMQSTMSKPARSSGRSAGARSGSSATVTSTGISGTSGKVDNSSRKAFLKSQIIEWKNKAKKAEASYQQALSGGDDSWQKKNVIDSKRRSVDEALEMVRQYEAELNSLK